MVQWLGHWTCEFDSRPPRDEMGAHLRTANDVMFHIFHTGQLSVLSVGWLIPYVDGWQVKLCDPSLTYVPYLSALKLDEQVIIKCYTKSQDVLLQGLISHN